MRQRGIFNSCQFCQAVHAVIELNRDRAQQALELKPSSGNEFGPYSLPLVYVRGEIPGSKAVGTCQQLQAQGLEILHANT